MQISSMQAMPLQIKPAATTATQAATVEQEKPEQISADIKNPSTLEARLRAWHRLMESERPNYQEYRADFARNQVEAAGQEKSEQLSAKLSADIENATTHEGKMRAWYTIMESRRPN